MLPFLAITSFPWVRPTSNSTASRIEPSELPFQPLGNPPDDGGLADPGYARQQQARPATIQLFFDVLA